MKKINKVFSIVTIVLFFAPLVVESRAGGSPSDGSYQRSTSGYQSSPNRYHGGSTQGGSYRSRVYQSGPKVAPPMYQTTTNPSSSYQVRQEPKKSSGYLPGVASGIAGSWLYNKFFNTPSNPNPNAVQTTTTTKNNEVVKQPAKPEKQSNTLMRMLMVLAIAYLVWRFINKSRKAKGDSTRTMDQNVNPNQSGSFGQQTSTPDMSTRLRDLMNQSAPGVFGGQAAATGAGLSSLSQADRDNFETILKNVQSAWSQYDVNGLQQLLTPPLFNNFAQIIRDNQQRGITNQVSQVELLSQELQESWQDGDTTYAKVLLTWRSIDYSVNNSLSQNDPGYLVEGSMDQPTQVTEIWTFAREGNSQWQVADIQQYS